MLSKIIRLAPKANFFPYLLLFFLFYNTTSNAQCAGADNAITICDISNPANQSVNLFNYLLGTPTPGGRWVDIQQSGGLDVATGILNVTLINQSETFEYIYELPAGSCSDTNASVSVTIGGYAGIGIQTPSPAACDDNNSVNLFQFLGGSPNPQINGVWSQTSGIPALSDNIFDASAAGIGNYSFTYTMPEIGTCPASIANINLTVYPAPEPGTTRDLIVCETSDLSIYSNLNLLDYITGQDSGGKWTESGTTELSGPFDTFINVQNIYTTSGPGEYNFTYTVLPSHPICTRKTATVSIIIEKQLDFRNSTLTVSADICENEIGTAVYTATLTRGGATIPNGNYTVDYQITGPVTTTATAVAVFNAGVTAFPIPRTSFPAIGTYTVTIVNIHETTGYNTCLHLLDDISDVVNVFPIPKINTGTLTAGPGCQNTDTPVILAGTTNLSDGIYQITFSLTGTNTANNQVATCTVSIGTGTFLIPGNLLPNIGNTSVRIIKIVNTATGCENTATLSSPFVVNPNPITANVAIAVNDLCVNNDAVVNVTGLGNLGSVIITYTLSGGNTGTAIETVVVSGGNASFIIPAVAIQNLGITLVTITGITNSTTLCGSNNLTISDSFLIKSVPAAPAASDLQYCRSDNPTVADLTPNGPGYLWYNNAAGNTPLNSIDLLQTGDYYVALAGNATLCNSFRAQIFVTVNDLPTPALQSDGENFCGLNVPAPTLAELSANTTATGTIVWYDAFSGGNQLPETTVLVDGFAYYGFDTDASGSCLSSNPLEVTVSLSDCDGEYALLIPDGFSPNGDGTNDTFNIPNIDFLYPDFVLEIYNRYGSLLYKGNRNTPDWDGKTNQSGANIDGTAPNGVYFYVVYFNKDGKSPKQGRLYLNR